MKWIRINRNFPLPSYVRDAIQKLDEKGHVAYVVGGSVRDFLLGREVKDHDIATNASPDQILELFPDAVTVGKAFGVIKVPLRGAGQAEFLEIATFREDLEYKDHRRPEGVRFSGPVEDARRRDFTINALFFDVKTSRVLDTTGGMEDLKAGVIRAIGNPMARFEEDALRLLRAARFATRFSFSLDEGTQQAIRKQAKLINHVSGERIRDELTLMWTGPKPAEALELLSKLGLLRHVLPEVEAIRGVEQSPLTHPEGDVWAHTLKVLRILVEKSPVRSAPLAWAAVLHDVGKAMALKSGQESEGSKFVFAIGERLKMARSEIDRIHALVQDLPRFNDVFKMREATLERFVREPHFEELLKLHQAYSLASDGNLAYYEFASARFEAAKKMPDPSAYKLVDGKDLIQLGFQPGPRFSEILRVIEDLALERKLDSKESALEYVIQHFVK